MKSNLERVRDIGKIKDEQGDIKRNIETKKSELSELKENKSELRQNYIEMQKSDASDELKEFVMGKINEELEANSKKGKELSTEMTEDVKTLDKLKENVREMTEATETESQKLEGKKSIFERFSGGKKIEEAIEKMNQEKNQLDSLGASLLEDEKELNKISHELNSL